jgi:hypothetical protein
MQIFKARILLIHVERVCRPPANVRSTPDGKIWVRTDVVSWSPTPEILSVSTIDRAAQPKRQRLKHGAATQARTRFEEVDEIHSSMAGSTRLSAAEERCRGWAAGSASGLRVTVRAGRVKGRVDSAWQGCHDAEPDFAPYATLEHMRAFEISALRLSSLVLRLSSLDFNSRLSF